MVRHFHSSLILIYDFSSSFLFSSCQRHIHFACVTSSFSLRAINLSLNYHSRDKLRGPPLSSAHDWSSLHYHYLITPSGPWLLVSAIVSARRWGGGEECPSTHPTPPKPSPHPRVNPFSFSAILLTLSPVCIGPLPLLSLTPWIGHSRIDL